MFDTLVLLVVVLCVVYKTVYCVPLDNYIVI